ncbi:hypothetical protein [Paenibacillus sp. FSL H8-0537]|uniref:hypothetical protein n=1 Tax=Paenibacillus sp. FSL H8-0537 TaxID=2921399 RepID=UPI003101459C
MPLLLIIAAISFITVKATAKKGSYLRLTHHQIAIIAFSLLLMLIQLYIPYRNAAFMSGALLSSLLSTALALLAVFLIYFRKNKWAYLSLAVACVSGIISTHIKIN